VTPQRVAMMRDVVLEYDDTRPVGLGCHEPPHADTQILNSLDLTGWNYARRYERYRERFPEKPIIYSESASALSTRGFYELPLPKTKTDYSDQRQVSSYDFNAAPWSDLADAEFRLMEKDDFVAGEFVWTGFDYLGEPTPFEQHARSSYFGIVDLCGLPKDRFYLYRSYWRPETPTVHILPHWNWPERVGQTVPVFVYTNGDSAELFLNGRSLGVRRKNDPPRRPQNLAAEGRVSVSSSDSNHPSHEAVDGSIDSFWRARSDDAEQHFEVDLGAPQPLHCMILEFEREAKHYGYVVRASVDGDAWEEIVSQHASDEPRWGGPQTAVHDIDTTARYIQVHFHTLPPRSAAGLREFCAYSEPAESTYYEPIYDYRLRWNDVVYEPGELKAVAYKDGREIGTAGMRTAGEPARIRLTADRTGLSASGDDLCYVQIEALDENGVPCPLADNLVRFDLTGPAEVAGVCNGNPLSLEPMQASQVKLFYGKAIVILRTMDREPGEIVLTATSPGLREATTRCQSFVDSNQ
jgi:Glycoside hydrolase family 2 C-terminal domain 5/F5/8 type C domain/Domain of unknown function (DUF4982)